MLNLFVASKYATMSNYLFLFLKEFSKDYEFRLVVDNKKQVDLLIIDSHSISPEECKELIGEQPTILFTQNIRPSLVSYTSIFDINGVLSLDMEPDDIHKTLQESIRGEIYYNDEMISMLFSPKINELASKVASVTSREIDIIKLMLKDKTNEEIALELNLSIRTVNAHKGNIMRKIGAKTTTGMIKMVLDYSPIMA